MPLGGCGTFSDALCGPADRRIYYRGVAMDVEGVKIGGPLALLAADIPASAVADTLLVPYIAYHRQTAAPDTFPSNQIEAPRTGEHAEAD